ncbi:hypothetical protein [Rhizobium leguminosarum]|uniref:hypothetical protein n=1 Tax=Rhizobium leguminosarum TaxID=384 RepID=UPI0018D4E0F9|nr:hypothetical protein [Rhizobium leguminosarum]
MISSPLPPPLMTFWQRTSIELDAAASFDSNRIAVGFCLYVDAATAKAARASAA